MAQVIGALIGLLATAFYAVGAAELLLGETGVDLLGAARARLPEDVLIWLTRVPLEPAEGAPMWRTLVLAIAFASGIAGSLFLIVRARLSAVLLWLSFLLLLGVLVGQDLAVAGGYRGAERPELFALAGVLGLALLFALISNAVTGQPKEEDDDEPTGYRDADRVRDLIRSDPPPRRPAQEPRSETSEPRLTSESAAEQSPLAPTDDLMPVKT